MGKSFKPKKKALDPVEFDIDGEGFVCKPNIPGTALLEFTAGMTVRHDGTQSEAILGLFQTAMEGAEYERFRKFVDDEKNGVDVDTLISITQYLVGEYGRDRPTKRSRGSTPGPSTTGTSSKDA